MAYGNYYGGFNPYISNPMGTNIPQMQTPQQMPSNQNNGIIWVQGEEAAKSYLVAPNTTVQLWDTERATIYLKSADASGLPSMRILDWTERGAAPKEEYVTRVQLDEILKKYAKVGEDDA